MKRKLTASEITSTFAKWGTEITWQCETFTSSTVETGKFFWGKSFFLIFSGLTCFFPVENFPPSTFHFQLSTFPFTIFLLFFSIFTTFPFFIAFFFPGKSAEISRSEVWVHSTLLPPPPSPPVTPLTSSRQNEDNETCNSVLSD